MRTVSLQRGYVSCILPQFLLAKTPPGVVGNLDEVVSRICFSIIETGGSRVSGGGWEMSPGNFGYLGDGPAEPFLGGGNSNIFKISSRTLGK